MQNYNTICKTHTHLVKNVFQCWRSFQPIFYYIVIYNVIFLSGKMTQITRNFTAFTRLHFILGITKISVRLKISPFYKQFFLIV